MADNAQSSATIPLTEEEHNFAESMTAFFGALEQLSVAQKQLIASGGDAFRAFQSTLPPESQELAVQQWPQISMILSSLSLISG